MSFDAHWRNTMKPARFFGGVDARAALVLLLLMVHFRIWTFLFAVGVMVVFSLLERRGLSFEAALRNFRRWIIGPERPRILHSHKQRWLDFG